MHLKTLYLKNFRNYNNAEVHFTPRINVFYGNNAQGKTNILEAIYLIATGRSFRTQNLSELIKEGESFFFLEAEMIKDRVSQTVKVSYDGKNKKVQIDGNTFATFHPLLGMLPSVLYTPFDIELISGSPTERRRFLNLHLAQSDPLYVHHLSRFWRSMKQRNCLLRAKNQESLSCWEIEMALSAEYIVKARQEMIDQLKNPLAQMSHELSEKQEVHELRYEISQSKHYLEQLKKNRVREMELGLTLTGPHRDELTLLIDKKPARIFASEGQKKTAIAALRFAEWDRLSQRVDTQALMGIDDLGQHLDETRQKLLRHHLNTLGQVFITTPHTPKDDSHHIFVENGSVNLSPISTH